MAEKAKAHLGARGHDVTETVVEESFDPEVEVRRHLDADLVVLQTSINWFGAPWNTAGTAGPAHHESDDLLVDSLSDGGTAPSPGRCREKHDEGSGRRQALGP